MNRVLSVIDAHAHLWDTSRLSYPWLADAPDLPARADGSDFVAAVANLPYAVVFSGAVIIQAECRPSEAEAEVRWLLEQLAAGAPVSAIVAYAPMEDPSAREVLESYATMPLVKGVRRNVQDERAGFPRRLTANVAALADYGLSFDICARTHQLGEVIDLVDRAAGTAFVLDHLAKPTIGSTGGRAWAQALDELASRPNVSCKLSGLATEAPPGWTTADMAPYVHQAIEAFGPKRIMFGSDWPVCTTATTYARWLETILAIIPAELHDLALVRNVTDFYRLTDELDDADG